MTVAATKLGVAVHRRLPWLLVFRAAVATALLLLTLIADMADWPMRRMSGLLYGVVTGTYVVVLVLAVLLRSNVPSVVVSAVYLAAAVMSAAIVTYGTGGVSSAFSFLYLLAVLDGAIVGGYSVALALASGASITYGLQLVLQLYEWVPSPSARNPSPAAFVSALVVHLAAFYSMALLSGRLAQLWRSALEAASTAIGNLERFSLVYEHVLHSLPVAVLTTDDHGKIVVANRAAHEMFGILLAGQVLPPEVVDICPRTYGEGDVERDGIRRWIAVWRSKLAAPDAGESHDGDVFVVEDRTHTKALELSLRQQERLASLGEMAASIAHELRNPLAAISGSLELLREGTGDAQSHRRLQDIVIREIDRLDKLVESFLQYARPAAPQWMKVDLVAVFLEVASLCEEQGKKDFVIWTLPAHLEAELDAAQIKQVLWNLLRNALDASASEKSIEVKLRRVDDETPWLVFEVLDRGTGFDPQIIEHAFEPFKTTKAGGTGLGLSMVHRIVQAHGGSITLKNRVDGGACVEIVLPISPFWRTR